MIKRHPKWEELMARYVESRSLMPFEWGANDCCSFSIYAIQAFTGSLIIPITWTDELSAMRTIVKLGGNLETACKTILGEPDIRPRMMRKGDVGIVNINNMDSVVLCIGYQVCAPSLESTLAFRPLSDVLMHWKVG